MPVGEGVDPSKSPQETQSIDSAQQAAPPEAAMLKSGIDEVGFDAEGGLDAVVADQHRLLIGAFAGEVGGEGEGAGRAPGRIEEDDRVVSDEVLACVVHLQLDKARLGVRRRSPGRPR